MPGHARFGDPVVCPADVHGTPPFGVVVPVNGKFLAGSPNTFVNSLPAVRVTDGGTHVACPGPNTFVAASGAPKYFINNLAAVRELDSTTHCGLSTGFVLAAMGSPNSFA